MQQGGGSMKTSQHYQNDWRSFSLGRARAKGRHKCPEEETEAVRGPLGDRYTVFILLSFNPYIVHMFLYALNTL